MSRLSFNLSLIVPCYNEEKILAKSIVQVIVKAAKKALLALKLKI